MSTARTIQTRGRIRLEPGAKRVRAFLGGVPVADTTRPMLVWEVPYYPAYYFPLADVRTELLEPDGGVSHSPSRVRSQLTPVSVIKWSVPGTAQTAGSVLPSASTALRCHGAGEVGSRTPNV